MPASPSPARASRHACAPARRRRHGRRSAERCPACRRSCSSSMMTRPRSCRERKARCGCRRPHAPRRCARGPTGRIARRPKRRECNTATSSEKRALNLPTVWGVRAISGTSTMADFPALHIGDGTQVDLGLADPVIPSTTTTLEGASPASAVPIVARASRLTRRQVVTSAHAFALAGIASRMRRRCSMRTTPRFSSDLRVALTLPSMAESSAARMAPQENRIEDALLLDGAAHRNERCRRSGGDDPAVIDGADARKDDLPGAVHALDLGRPPGGEQVQGIRQRAEVLPGKSRWRDGPQRLSQAYGSERTPSKHF